MVQQHSKRARAQRRTRSAEFYSVFRQERFHQQRNILFAVSQRGQSQARTRDAIVELASKASRPHFIVKIPAGRGNHPGSKQSAPRPRITIRQSVKKASLAGRLKLADFVKEYSSRSALGGIFRYIAVAI